MFDKIISYGCSNTLGNMINDDHFNRYSWATILAEKLNCQLDNRGWYGVSNEYILRKILETDPKDFEDTLVLILWTYSDRRELYHDYKYYKIGPWSPYDSEYPTVIKMLSKYNNKYFNDPCMNVRNMYNTIHYAQLYLEKLNVNYYMGIMESMHECEGNIVYELINKSLIFDVPFYEDYIMRYPLPDDEWHLTYEGHSQYANDFFEWMNGKL